MPSNNSRRNSRNLAALSPLLKKGGSHKKSKSGQRRKEKNELKKEVNRLAKQGDFFSYIEFMIITHCLNC